MENESAPIHMHISELYLKYENLKKEIKRDREEIYSITMKQLNELKKQNESLRKQINLYKDMDFVKQYIESFAKLMSKICIPKWK